jgi:uncharacterized protein
MYKISQFNHFHPWLNGNFLAYNALSGAVGLMTEENYNVYKAILEKLSSEDEVDFTPEEAHLIQQLQYGRFIYPAFDDELKTLKFQHHMSRYDQTSLGLAIAPTMACNMACEYCYEGNKKGRMQPEVIENILNFVEPRAAAIRALDINWYGGEPLLAMDIIEDITESLLDLGEEYKYDYSASMVTNGYLLNSETVDRLSGLKVGNLQITLDGPSLIHNRKRPLKNGQDSFDTILKNIAYAAGKFVINIRVNVDKSFTPVIISQLLEELDQAGVKDGIGLYFGRLEASTIACANIAEDCYGAEGFAKIETDYYRLLLQKGFSITHLPSPVGTACFAQLVNSFMLDPEGNLYKCYNFVGDVSKAMGNIRDSIDYRHPNFREYFKFDPFEDGNCRSCNILPVCMGGCPARRANSQLDEGEACETWKHNLKPMLEIIALSRQRQPQTATKEQP